jgi:hypothetical protein
VMLAISGTRWMARRQPATDGFAATATSTVAARP